MHHRNQRHSSSRKESGNKDKSCCDELKDGARKLAEGIDKSMHGESEARVFPSVPKYGPQYSTPEHEHVTEGARRLKEGIIKSMQGESEAQVFPFVPKYPPQYGPEKLVIQSAHSDSTSSISGAPYSESPTSIEYRHGPSRKDSVPYRPRGLSTVQEEQQRYSPQESLRSPVNTSGTGSIYGDSHQSHRPSSLREEANRDIVSSPPPRSRVPTEKSSSASSPRESRHSAREERPSPQTRSKVAEDKPANASSQRESRHIAREERSSPQARPKVPEVKPTHTSSQRESHHSAREERPGPQTRPEVAEDKPSNTSTRRESHRNSREERPKSTTSSVHSKSVQTAEPARRVGDTPSGRIRGPPSRTSSYAQSVETSELSHNTVAPRKDKHQRRSGDSSNYAQSIETSELLGTATIRAGESIKRSDKKAGAQKQVKEDKGAASSPLGNGPTTVKESGVDSDKNAKIQKWITDTNSGSPSTRTPHSSDLSGSSSFPS
ncbi:hypothetical protein ACEPAF_2384 [Sanghuangporus sanghuang]